MMNYGSAIRTNNAILNNPKHTNKKLKIVFTRGNRDWVKLDDGTIGLVMFQQNCGDRLIYVEIPVRELSKSIKTMTKTFTMDEFSKFEVIGNCGKYDMCGQCYDDKRIGNLYCSHCGQSVTPSLINLNYANTAKLDDLFYTACELYTMGVMTGYKSIHDRATEYFAHYKLRGGKRTSLILHK